MSALRGRPWIQTWSGRAWCADDPEGYEYDMREIAHALSQINRFCGQTVVPYSVAEHSVRVAWEVRAHLPNDRLCLAALLHDAAEAFLNDFASPIKRMPELAGYRALMTRTERAIARHFGVEEWLDHPAVKRADLVLLTTERRDVLGPSPHTAEWLEGLPSPLPERIVPWTPELAREAFREAWQQFGAAS